MAPTMDQMIANDERHAQECEKRELAAFKQKHDCRIDMAFAATAVRIRSETNKRRQEMIVDVCEEVWKQVMGGEHTKVVVKRTIDDRDLDYYNNMARPIVAARLGVDPATGARRSSRSRLTEMTMVRGRAGTRSSG